MSPVLMVVTAQIQLAFVIHDANPHLIQPSVSTQHVTSERLICGKIDRHVERVTESFQRQHVAVSVKAAHHRAETKWTACLYCQSQCLGVTALEYTERSTRVQPCRKLYGTLPEVERYWNFEAAFVRTVVMEGIEIESVHASLPSTNVGVRFRRDVNEVRGIASRLASSQIDFARVGAVRDECVAL
jgi:hypothetical protein